jgi:hypothetical protein
VTIEYRVPKSPIDGWIAWVVVDGKRYQVPRVVGHGTRAGVNVAFDSKD